MNMLETLTCEEEAVDYTVTQYYVVYSCVQLCTVVHSWCSVVNGLVVNLFTCIIILLSLSYHFLNMVCCVVY